MVRWVDYLSVVFVLMLVFGVVFVLELKVTGKNIAPNYRNNNEFSCNESYVYDFWDKYFREDLGKPVVVWEIDSNCDEGFVSYKVLNKKVYYLIKEKDYGYGTYRIKGVDRKYLSKEFYKIGLYEFNESGYLKKISSEKDFNKLNLLFSDVDEFDLKDLDVGSVRKADSLFEKYFKNYIKEDFEGFYPGYFVANNSVESMEGDYFYKKKGLKFISKTKSDLGFGYLVYKYGPLSEGNLLKRIPNLKFKTSKYWKYGFSVRDYFDDKGCVFYFGLNDSSKMVLGKISGDNVLFKSLNFSGYKKFDVVCEKNGKKIFSNKFWVSFYDRVNRAPVQIYLIDNFNLSAGEKMKVPLDDFFKDPENDSLNFVVFGSDNLDFVMEGNDLYVSFKRGLEKEGWFQLNVSDGELTITSNKVNVGFVKSKKQENLLLSFNETNNKSSKKLEEEVPEQTGLKKYKIFAIIGVVLVMLEAAALIIYFGILKKRTVHKGVVQRKINEFRKEGVEGINKKV